MDPKLLLLWPVLTACPTLPTSHVVRSMTVTPIREWPEDREHSDKTDPPHGEESGESPLYGGLAVYGNVSNAASGSFISDSGASGTHNYNAVGGWLPNHFPLATSTRELDNEPYFPWSRPNLMIHVGPDSKKHRTNPSTKEVLRSNTRRQK